MTVIPLRKPEFTMTALSSQSVTKASSCDIAALNDLDDGQAEFLSELPVALVVGRERAMIDAGSVGPMRT